MFGGGRRFQGPWGDVVSANITCHPSGISHYDAAMFIKTIRTGRASAGVRDLSAIMPYSYFRKMSDEDLTAIFAYLHSVKPVFHEVDNSEPLQNLQAKTWFGREKLAGNIALPSRDFSSCWLLLVPFVAPMPFSPRSKSLFPQIILPHVKFNSIGFHQL
jgi:hypothetical protein